MVLQDKVSNNQWIGWRLSYKKIKKNDIIPIFIFLMPIKTLKQAKFKSIKIGSFI